MKLLSIIKKKGDLGRVKSWKAWRLLTRDRLEYQVIYQKLSSLQDYLEEKNIVLTHEQKMQDILMVTSPFALSDELLNEFLQELTQPFPYIYSNT